MKCATAFNKVCKILLKLGSQFLFVLSSIISNPGWRLVLIPTGESREESRVEV